MESLNVNGITPETLASAISRVKTLVEYHIFWPVLEELPIGWRIDSRAGSPLVDHKFATNGKSDLGGNQERALVRVSR